MICARLPRKSRLARPRYYITSVWVCQGVFEKFFGFFQVFSWSSLEPFTLGLSPEVPDYYITTLFICQEVFEKFFKNFSWLFGSFLSESDPPIISHLFSFVKRFFESFLTFSWSLGALFGALRGASRSAPAYYSTSIPFCQGVFPKFFQFGFLGSLS